MTRSAARWTALPSTRRPERGLGRSPKVLVFYTHDYTLCNLAHKDESPTVAELAFIHSLIYTVSAIKNDGVYRGLKGAEYVGVSGRHARSTRAQRPGQIRSEPEHSGSGLVRVPAPTGLQAPMERRVVGGGTATQYQPNLSGLRPCVSREPPNASAIPLRGVRLQRECRHRWRDQHFKGGTRPVRL
ncbi:hypothetical protein ACSSVV_001613 [Marinobacter sp. MBR-105]